MTSKHIVFTTALLACLSIPSLAEHGDGGAAPARARAPEEGSPGRSPEGPANEELKRLVIKAWFRNAEPLDAKAPVEELAATTVPLLLDAFQLIPGKSAREKADLVGDFLTGEVEATDPSLSKFLARVEGKDPGTKLRNLEILLGGPKARMGTRMKILRKVLALIPEGNRIESSRRDSIYAAARRDFLPVLLAMAGKDGLLNHADVGPIVGALILPEEIERQVEGAIEKSKEIPRESKARAMNLYRSDYENMRELLESAARELASERGGARLVEFLNRLGVEKGESEDEEGETAPLRRDRVESALREFAVAKIFAPGKREGSGLPLDAQSAPDYFGLGLFIAMPGGIPVKALARSIREGTLPEVRLTIREADQKLVIQEK